jgi:dihydroorotase
VTAAASVNHLTLNEIDIGAYRTFFKVSPPLRRDEDRVALIEALSEGLLDVVMSDHNPQDVETKRLPVRRGRARRDRARDRCSPPRCASCTTAR